MLEIIKVEICCCLSKNLFEGVQ